MAAKKVVTLALAWTFCIWHGVSYGESLNMESSMDRVWIENGKVMSSACSSGAGQKAVQKKIAVANAGRGILKWRDGVHMSGSERVENSMFSQKVHEDVIGVIGRLVVTQERTVKVGKDEILCVTVMEDKET